MLLRIFERFKFDESKNKIQAGEREDKIFFCHFHILVGCSIVRSAIVLCAYRIASTIANIEMMFYRYRIPMDFHFSSVSVYHFTESFNISNALHRQHRAPIGVRCVLISAIKSSSNIRKAFRIRIEPWKCIVCVWFFFSTSSKVDLESPDSVLSMCNCIMRRTAIVYTWDACCLHFVFFLCPIFISNILPYAQLHHIPPALQLWHSLLNRHCFSSLAWFFLFVVSFPFIRSYKIITHMLS